MILLLPLLLLVPIGEVIVALTGRLALTAGRILARAARSVRQGPASDHTPSGPSDGPWRYHLHRPVRTVEPWRPE